MARTVAHTAFDAMHPAVPAVYLVVTLGLTMFSMHPVLVAISLAGGFAYGACVRGFGGALASLRWQLPVVVVVALLNPLFVSMGSTPLFWLFGRPVYLESLCYGLAMAGMFLASVQWFAAGSAMLTHDKVLGLLGNAAPTVGLMVSMTMRLVPRLLRQGRAIASVQDVVTGGARLASRKGVDSEQSGCLTVDRMPANRVPARPSRRLPPKTALRLRQSSVLMGWAMEDSLETADAMRARGWGACSRRTTYQPYHFTVRDAAAIAVLALGAAACAWVAWSLTAAYAFYPVLTPVELRWGYVLYALWMIAPAVLHIYETRRFA